MAPRVLFVSADADDIYSVATVLYGTELVGMDEYMNTNTTATAAPPVTKRECTNILV